MDFSYLVHFCGQADLSVLWLFPGGTALVEVFRLALSSCLLLPRLRRWPRLVVVHEVELYRESLRSRRDTGCQPASQSVIHRFEQRQHLMLREVAVARQVGVDAG